jgi:sec-independent protein translocase protein TatA
MPKKRGSIIGVEERRPFDCAKYAPPSSGGRLPRAKRVDFEGQGKCCAPARCAAALLILTLSCHRDFLWYKSHCRSIRQPPLSLKSAFCMRSVRGGTLPIPTWAATAPVSIRKDLPMPLGIQPIHIIIIIVVAVLIFGPNKLPEIGRGAGKAISEFRNASKGLTDSFHQEMSQPGAQAVPPPTQTAASSGFAPAGPAFMATDASIATDVSIQPQATSASLAGRFCMQCGAPNPVEARFCNSCGSKLAEMAA